MIAFEISINGKNVCVAGVANGLTSAMISRVEDGTDLVDLHVTGTVDPAGDPHSCAWEMPFVTIGDVVSIKIVDTVSVTPPDSN